MLPRCDIIGTSFSTLVEVVNFESCVISGTKGLSHPAFMYKVLIRNMNSSWFMLSNTLVIRCCVLADTQSLIVLTD